MRAPVKCGCADWRMCESSVCNRLRRRERGSTCARHITLDWIGLDVARDFNLGKGVNRGPKGRERKGEYWPAIPSAPSPGSTIPRALSPGLYLSGGEVGGLNPPV